MPRTDPDFFATAFGLAQFWFAPMVALAISAVYFVTSPKNQPMAQRFAASGHGAVICILYLTAMACWILGVSKRSYGFPFAVLLLFPVLLMGLSFFLYRGPRFVHGFQVLNLLCLAWTFFIGGMAVTGDWL